MTTDEIEGLCFFAHSKKMDRVTLTLPAGFKRTLGFPRGELLSINPAGEQNRSYDPLKLLAWLRTQWTQTTSSTPTKDAS